MLKRWLIYLASVLFGLALVGALLGAFVFALLYPTLPSLETLTDYQPKIPLRIVSAEGELLGEFGEERRAIVKIKEVPDVMSQAILAAEDERFYQHGGVDYLIGAAGRARQRRPAGRQQGAGTITMQVARNFFLTRERTLTRKLREVLLAYKIEANLSKDEILELYVNQIFLGQRAYGFAAASQIYFGKPLAAGRASPRRRCWRACPRRRRPTTRSRIPSGPGRASCMSCGACTSCDYITDDQFAAGAERRRLQSVQTRREYDTIHAEFVAEMARQIVFEAYGEDATRAA